MIDSKLTTENNREDMAAIAMTAKITTRNAVKGSISVLIKPLNERTDAGLAQMSAQDPIDVIRSSSYVIEPV